MARGVFPGDLEEPVFRTEPMQTGVSAAVHLGQQPGLQADPPGLDAHDVETGGSGRKVISVEVSHSKAKRCGDVFLPHF